MLRVKALTQGICVPSARFRIRQYVEPLRTWGIQLFESPNIFSAYPPSSSLRRGIWGGAALAGCAAAACNSYSYDVTLMQREFISTMATLERWTKGPRIFDVDDAIWLNSRNLAAARIAQHCRAVVCGNDFIADYFAQYCDTIFILPTAVDTNRFTPAPNAKSSEKVIVGWTGSSSGLREIESLQTPIAAAMNHCPQLELHVSCDQKPNLQELPSDRVHYFEWNKDTEVGRLQQFDIGLMPLRDNDWNRGKCSYKLLLYMACGKPFIASPVGMNARVLRSGCGLPARSHTDWTEAIVSLAQDPAKRGSLGREGRKDAELNYSVRALTPQLAHILRASAS